MMDFLIQCTIQINNTSGKKKQSGTALGLASKAIALALPMISYVTFRQATNLCALLSSLLNGILGDFSGGPGVKNRLFSVEDVGSIPGFGIKTPPAPGQLSLGTTAEEACALQ